MDPPMHYQHPSSSHYAPAHPQLSSTSQIFQYTPSNPPTTSNPDQTLIQPLDTLPTEYDLVSQTPEERAVLLEVLRERRRVRELELKILEERRREREAGEQAVQISSLQCQRMSARGDCRRAEIMRGQVFDICTSSRCLERSIMMDTRTSSFLHSFFRLCARCLGCLP